MAGSKRTMVPASNGSERVKVSMSSTKSPVLTSRYLDHRAAPGTPQVSMMTGIRTPQVPSRVAAGDRVPTFLIPAEEKQGKESKTPDIIQHARNCPVAWTSKITNDKLSMGLWSWAYVSELLATRTGILPTLPQGVLEARLQHFLNTLEVALQASSASDYDNHAWHVARLYAEKVQQKIDRGGGSWLQFAERYGADSQPHELMAAREEMASKAKKAATEKHQGVKIEEKKRRNCTTWNSSLQEGKCEFEVQYEGRKCDRRHECSWCKEKGKKSLHHQKSFCRLRLAGGD